jgi:hypothetical protein
MDGCDDGPILLEEEFSILLEQADEIVEYPASHCLVFAFNEEQVEEEAETSGVAAVELDKLGE